MTRCDLKYLHQYCPDSLEIESLEGSVYLLFAVVDGTRMAVYEGGQPLRSQSLSAMRKRLIGSTCTDIYLCQRSAYDEMLSQPLRVSDNTLRIRLAPLDERSPI